MLGTERLRAAGLGNTSAVLDRTPNAIGPINVGGTVSAIAVGGTNTCAILTNGNVRCWGSNLVGELGRGNTTDYTMQTPSAIGGSGSVSLGTTATAVTIGASVCAQLTGGTVRCWGFNGFGGLGLGNTTAVSSTMVPSAYAAVPFPAGYTASQMAGGGGNTCARVNGAMPGQLECWGWNNVGQLGLGHVNNIGDNESPALAGLVITSATGISSVVAGGQHTCWIAGTTPALRCWGLNTKGQLGLPNTTNQGTTAATVPSMLANVAFGGSATPQIVAAGDFHTCAVLSGAPAGTAVRCWGRNNRGQLGLGFVSTGAVDYVGGDAATTPNNATMTSVDVFPP